MRDPPGARFESRRSPVPKPTSREGIATIISRLRDSYPNARYELDWETPEQLLVATILAAQCTDERVNKVTKTLFVKYPSPQAFAEADITELEEDLRPTGFYKQKAKSVREVNRAICEYHGGRVPQSIEEMITLPGVARKSANVVLNTAFNMPTGIIVDTHVSRVAPRLGLTKKEKPEEIEADLMKLVPKETWTFFGPAMVLHGRYTCVAKKPKCGECNLEDLCEKRGVE
jgi:endonuclease-3